VIQCFRGKKAMASLVNQTEMYLGFFLIGKQVSVHIGSDSPAIRYTHPD
jgi:hypothetical protein